jgi:hypothetical protein
VRLRRRFALTLSVVTPLVVVLLVGITALTAEGRSELPVAQGSSGGIFHPVAGAFEPDDTSLAGCGDDYSCLQQAFGNVAYRNGPKAAFRQIEAKLADNRLVQIDCHRIVHFIGSAALARYDQNVARAFASGSALCAAGYYHGILERAFAGARTRSELAEFARSLCVGTDIRRRGFLDYQCRHGLGHGLMIQSGYDLPLASSTCARLASRWDEIACLGGVFMENATTRFGFRSPWLRDDAPLYPCGAMPARSRPSCYSRAPYRVLELNGRDFPNAATMCRRLAQKWSTPCFRGFGREVFGKARHKPEKMVSLCRLAWPRQGDCLYGAARAISDSQGIAGVKRAAMLCKRVSPDVRGKCWAGAGAIVGLLYAADANRRGSCADIAGEYEAACVRGALAEIDPRAERAWS